MSARPHSLLRICLAAVVLATSTVILYVPCACAAPSTPELDAAREQAIALEADIEEIRAEQIALESRIDVTNQRIFRQQEILADAREELSDARLAYRDRVIRMYKAQIVDPISILLTAESLADLYNRALVLTRISQRDHAAYKDAAIATAEAEYQAAHLDDLKRMDVDLRQIQSNSLRRLDEALDEQNALVEQLTADALVQLQAVRATNEKTRREWIDSSISIGAQIEMAQATVDTHPGVTFTVPAYQPHSYISTGRSETMVCSWYGNEFNGRPTASGQIFNEEDLTCASRTLPFGTRLALTRGNYRIVVVVTDRGPFIEGRDLDLSKAAARLLGFSGVEPVQAEFVNAAP